MACPYCHGNATQELQRRPVSHRHQQLPPRRVPCGNNTVLSPPQRFVGYQTGPTWNLVTGWGSPDAAILVPLLARYVHPDDGLGL